MADNPLDARHLGAHHFAGDLEGGAGRLLYLGWWRFGELQPIVLEGAIVMLRLGLRRLLRLNGIVHIVAIVHDVHGATLGAREAAKQQQRYSAQI